MMFTLNAAKIDAVGIHENGKYGPKIIAKCL
jgi:hypothetical protein